MLQSVFLKNKDFHCESKSVRQVVMWALHLLKTEDRKMKRVLLKLSGEAMGEDGKGFDFAVIRRVAEQLAILAKQGIQVGVVIGAGNIWRGRQGTDMDRVTADHMGMLATVVNSLAMKDAVLHTGTPCKVMTSIPMESVAEVFSARHARRALEEGYVVIFAGGTGSPFFSTDTAAALRAAEIEADAILLAKNIDGVYDADPRRVPSAKRYCTISFEKVLQDRLAVMDSAATAICMDQNIPVTVFALQEENSIARVCAGEKLGTTVENGIETAFYA